MPHILVPADFSINAKHAYIYALQLAFKSSIPNELSKYEIDYCLYRMPITNFPTLLFDQQLAEKQSSGEIIR